MQIFSAVMHPNGFFIHADTRLDLLVMISKKMGWGRFGLVAESEEFSPDGGIFELQELLPELPVQPLSVIHSSNVLWRLQEAREVLQSASSSLNQGHLLPGLYPQEQ